jgi:putative membrane protein
MHLLIRLIINAIVLYLIARYVPGFQISGFTAAIIAAIIFGLVNAVIRPIVLLLSLPATILTLGLFVIIVNALMFWLTVWITPGFHVSGFVPALIGGIIMTIVSILTNHLFKPEREPVRTPAAR